MGALSHPNPGKECAYHGLRRVTWLAKPGESEHLWVETVALARLK